MTAWKRVAVMSASAGGGAMLVLALLVGSVVWYNSLSKRPKPWNPVAIRIDGRPSFATVGEDQHIGLAYTVTNTTSDDYDVSESNAAIDKIMLKLSDDSLVGPVKAGDFRIRYPLFIPAKQKGTLIMEVLIAKIKRNDGEDDDSYHERIREYMNLKLDKVNGFVVFDDSRRYQINLPKWSTNRE